MKLFVYEYVGEYCHGGYVCIAENEKKAQNLLIKTYASEQDKEDTKEDFAGNSLGVLELKHTLQTDVITEMILLDSYDCC